MSIILGSENRIIVQGITGEAGSRVCADMIAYGTNVVAGVTPGKKGAKVHNLPVYDSVKEAVTNHSADSSLIMIAGSIAMEAIFEALESNIKVVVYPGEGLPVHDMLLIKKYLRECNAMMIGGNSPGIISPGKGKMGFMPSFCYREGTIGVISKSGSLSYEVCKTITDAGYGESSVVGIGGDSIPGMDYVDVLKLFKYDEQTKAVVILGEIGGRAEIKAAEYIKNEFTKPVIAFLAGRTAPPGQKMGHAGAILRDPSEGYESKVKILRDAGVTVVNAVWEIPSALNNILKTGG